MPAPDRTRLLHAWARDLATCTETEIRERWTGDKLKALSKVDPIAFEERLRNHNPLWFLALNCWFDNDPSLLHAPLHRDQFCRALLEHYLDPSREFRGLILLAPRESFKSTFTHGVFAMFILLRGKHVLGRDERIQLIHHKETQVIQNLVKLKAKFIQHRWLKEVWPEFCAEEDFGSQRSFDTPCKEPGVLTEPSVVASGMGASQTGFHCDWQLYSDAVTEDHVDSKLERDNAELRYTTSRYMLDSLRGKEVMDGTRYHPQDLYGKNLAANVSGKPIYRSLILSAISEDNVLLFPNRLSYEFLESRRQEEISRRRNDDFWYLQYQNQPRVSRLIAAQWEWIRHCKREEVPATTWRAIFVDPAWKGTANSGEGDFASIQVWAFERRGNLTFKYLLDGVHANDLTDLDGRSIIFRLMRRYGVVDVAPEEIGGRSFRESLVREAAQRGVFINVIDLKYTNVGKSQRITNFLGECQRGLVFLCDEADSDLLEHFRDEFVNFPQVDHDDALDAAAQSCDPAVAERCAPLFNSIALGGFDDEEEPIARRTRYCTI